MKLVAIGDANPLRALSRGLSSCDVQLHAIHRTQHSNYLIDMADLHHINTCDAVILFGTWGSKHPARAWNETNNTLSSWLETLDMFIVNYCNSIGKKYIVLETGTLSRARTLYGSVKEYKQLQPRYYRMGLNHWTYGSGKFCSGADFDRLENMIKNFPDMKEQVYNHKWKNNKNGYILILPGLEHDPTSNISVDIFVEKAIEDIRKISDRKIYIKPHPLSSVDFTKMGAEVLKKQPIEIIAKDVYCAITESSTSVFELIMLGIPCITSDNSFGAPLKNTNINDVEKLYYANADEIAEWCKMLSYTEFTMGEFNSPEILNYIAELLE